jgi:hypothetical protein
VGWTRDEAHPDRKIVMTTRIINIDRLLIVFSLSLQKIKTAFCGNFPANRLCPLAGMGFSQI